MTWLVADHSENQRIIEDVSRVSIDEHLWIGANNKRVSTVEWSDGSKALAVQQGSLLSPILFPLHLNDLNRHTKASSKRVLVDYILFQSLLYADDLILLASDRETTFSHNWMH